MESRISAEQIYFLTVALTCRLHLNAGWCRAFPPFPSSLPVFQWAKNREIRNFFIQPLSLPRRRLCQKLCKCPISDRHSGRDPGPAGQKSNICSCLPTKNPGAPFLRGGGRSGHRSARRCFSEVGCPLKGPWDYYRHDPKRLIV